MGTFDRTVRILIFVAIAILFITKNIEGTFSYILLAFAVIFMITSLWGFCPLYKIFGVNTCKNKSENDK